MSHARHGQGTYKNVAPETSHNRHDQGSDDFDTYHAPSVVWSDNTTHQREPTFVPIRIELPEVGSVAIEPLSPVVDSPTSVPDSGATFALLGLGLAVLATLRRYKR